MAKYSLLDGWAQFSEEQLRALYARKYPKENRHVVMHMTREDMILGLQNANMGATRVYLNQIQEKN